MTELTDLKRDLAIMWNYKGWLEAIRNVSKEDMSEEYRPCVVMLMENTIGILERMIVECRIFIGTIEGYYEKTEE